MSAQQRTPQKKRQPDGDLALFGGKLVNRQRIAKDLNVSPERVSAMIAMPDGLPHIRMGLRYYFDPEAVLAWFLKRQTQNNPSRSKKSQ